MLRFSLASRSLRNKQECIVEAAAPRGYLYGGGQTCQTLIGVPSHAHPFTPRVGCAHNKHSLKLGGLHIMIPSKFSTLFPLLILTIVALSAAPASSAQACSDRTLNGKFGYTVTGTIMQNSGPLVAGPFVAVGRIVFDGKGGVSTIRSLNDNGIVLQNDSGTGTYAINPDCTGTFNITVGPPADQIQLTLSIVLDDTDQVRGVVTTPNVVLAFDARKQLPFFY